LDSACQVNGSILSSPLFAALSGYGSSIFTPLYTCTVAAFAACITTAPALSLSRHAFRSAALPFFLFFVYRLGGTFLVHPHHYARFSSVPRAFHHTARLSAAGGTTGRTAQRFCPGQPVPSPAAIIIVCGLINAVSQLDKL